VDQTGESSGTDGRVFFFYSNGSTDLMWSLSFKQIYFQKLFNKGHDLNSYF
jgi:hypothetical protein